MISASIPSTSESSSSKNINSSEEWLRIFQQIFASVPVGLALIDTELRFVLVNPRLAQMNGVSPDDHVGRTIFEIVPTVAHRAAPLLRLVVSTGQPILGLEMTAPSPTNDRETKTWTINWLPLRGETNDVIGICAMIEDITERKQAQRDRLAMAHALRVSTMGEFAASLAHELTQPLTAIFSNAEASLAYLEADKPNLTECRAGLNDIVHDCLRARKVIERLRAMLRKSRPEYKPIEINPLITEVLELFNKEARNRAILIATDLSEELPLVWADSIALQQVMMNLVLNAMEVLALKLPDQGQITIRTRCDPRGQVYVAVEDDGPGISEEGQRRLFEPFYSTKAEGLGMGLSLSHSIVESHGGRLIGENRSEGGAVFHFSLPAYR